MDEAYSNKFGTVWVVDENTYALEKYYDSLESLFNEETFVFEDVTELDFYVLKRTIYTKENEGYLLLQDYRGLHEPNGPEWKWVLKFDLEYLGE